MTSAQDLSARVQETANGGADPLQQVVGRSGARPHWPLLAMLGAYAVAAVVVPTLAPVSMSDDWVYTRSVEILLAEGRVELLDVSGASALFQILWGAAFAAVLPELFGSLRFATVVFWGLSGVGAWALLVALGLRRPLVGLGTAAYLFSPLGLPLAFTFMTDGYFTGLVTISAALYATALRDGRFDERLAMLGSVLAGVAVWQRPHGVLVPMGVVAALLVSGDLRWTRTSLRRFAAVVGPAVSLTAVFYAWLLFVHGATSYQAGFLSSVLYAGVDATVLLVSRVTYIQLMYIGMFALPIALAMIPALRGVVRGMRAPGWALLAVWQAVILLGFGFFANGSRLMPYVPHFLGRSGLGPNDIAFARDYLFNDSVARAFTILCAVSSLIFGLVLLERIGRSKRSADGRVAILCTAVGAFQVVGVYAPSFFFREWTAAGQSAPSLDRYLLPLVPFVLALGLWAIQDRRWVTPIAALTVAAASVLSVAGTRDSVTFQQVAWDLARNANERGIENQHLDAGFAWDAYHLWTPAAKDQPTNTPSPPWWVSEFAPATDSSYVVAGGVPEGFTVVDSQDYSLWLESPADRRQTMYLLRREEGA